MRSRITVIGLVFLAQVAIAQKPSTVNTANVLAKYDAGTVWTLTKNESILGFIGDNYQRIRVKFLNAAKTNATTYTVTGKTMVKENVCSFSGTMVIDKVTTVNREFENERGQIEKKQVYVLSGHYTFNEDKNCSHAGVFRGMFQSSFYIDGNNSVHYDDVESYADGFKNNQFQGSWTAYNSKAGKTCNWGDYRIPKAGNLDMGAGEFSPDEKYLKNGWQTYRDAYNRDDEKAKKAEEAKWWE